MILETKQIKHSLSEARIQLERLQQHVGQVRDNANAHRGKMVSVNRSSGIAAQIRSIFDKFGIEPDTMDFGLPAKKAGTGFWQQEIVISFVAGYADTRALIGELGRAVPGVSIQILKLSRADMEVGAVACDLGLRATYVDGEAIEAHAH